MLFEYGRGGFKRRCLFHILQSEFNGTDTQRGRSSRYESEIDSLTFHGAQDSSSSFLNSSRSMHFLTVSPLSPIGGPHLVFLFKFQILFLSPANHMQVYKSMPSCNSETASSSTTSTYLLPHTPHICIPRVLVLDDGARYFIGPHQSHSITYLTNSPLFVLHFLARV